ncbi:UvrD-helicase domain-containing protein [soil metagenome]
MNFTVYRSSAGSGKTFTLVKEYLKIALSDTVDPPQRYRKILAITFTNKAAAEMKDRIIRSLKELSAPQAENESPMAKELKSALQLDSLTLATRAANVLRAILHNYTDFAIGTIDSFTHRIVRAFAHDLRLPVNFEVEMDGEKLVREAVDILISRIGDDPQLTELLVQFSSRKADEEKTWQIERELQEIGKELIQEDGARNAKLLGELTIPDFMKINSQLKKSVKEFEGKIELITKSAADAILTSGCSIEEFAYGKSGLAARLLSYSTGDLSKFGENQKNIEKIIDGGKHYSGKCSKSSQELISQLQPEMEITWQKLEVLRAEDFPTYVFHKLILQNIYALAVLNEIKKIIFTFRSEQNVLHISEFNRIISEIVFAEPVPFIYERLGEKYSNYLIDEFQDTSVVQWQNLLPLIENSLAGNFFNMLVGDGKQAIYRWRGGDVNQFAKLPLVIDPSGNPLIKEREQSLVRNYKAQHLGTNYRSKSEIIKFNNIFFRKIAGKLGLNSNVIYDQLEQQSVSGKDGGYVRIEMLQSDKEDKKAIFISKTIEQVQLLIHEGWSNADISILVRENKDGARIAAALIENGIPVLSSDSLLLKQSAIVNFMVSMLRCVDYREDELAGAQVLEFLVSSKSININLHECLEEYFSTGKSLQQVFANHSINLDLLRLSRIPIYQRCEEIISSFHLGNLSDAYLVFFLDEILNYTNSRGRDKYDFFAYWEDRSKNASVVVPVGMNAVNVMTIHKSKGLEFPIVIIPFANWEIDKNRGKKWIHFSDPEIPELNTALLPLNKEMLKTPFAEVYEDEKDKTMLDAINSLYVAMTRAEHRLYVFTEETEKTESNYISSFFRLAQDAFENNFVENVFEFGSPGNIETNSKAKIKCIRPDKINSNPWEGRVSIRSSSSEHWDSNDANGSRDNGNLIHEILADIISAEDIDGAIEKAVQNGNLNSKEKADLLLLIKNIIELPEIKAEFSGKGRIRRETELLLPDGKRLRPDRVVETDKETIILDYKTGLPEKKHRIQLDDYANVLKQMGYSGIRKKIVYTESLTVESWT